MSRRPKSPRRLSLFPGIKEANVYGVVIPGGEGKAGMASLVTAPEFDIEALVAHLEEYLPSYARPIFLRFQQQIEATSTFKQRKVELQKQGFNPSLVADPIYRARCRDRPLFRALRPSSTKTSARARRSCR